MATIYAPLNAVKPKGIVTVIPSDVQLTEEEYEELYKVENSQMHAPDYAKLLGETRNPGLHYYAVEHEWWGPLSRNEHISDTIARLFVLRLAAVDEVPMVIWRAIILNRAFRTEENEAPYITHLVRARLQKKDDFSVLAFLSQLSPRLDKNPHMWATVVECLPVWESAVVPKRTTDYLQSFKRRYSSWVTTRWDDLKPYFVDIYPEMEDYPVSWVLEIMGLTNDTGGV